VANLCPLRPLQPHGAVLFPILVLTAWIYFFFVIPLVGAEVVAIEAIEEAEQAEKPIGPEPEETVSKHRVLRERLTLPRPGAPRRLIPFSSRLGTVKVMPTRNGVQP
jgi:hypothetical protein